MIWQPKSLNNSSNSQESGIFLHQMASTEQKRRMVKICASDLTVHEKC